MKDVSFQIAGLFVSNGKGRHLTRTMPEHELIFVKSGTLHIREGSCSFAVGPGQYLILRGGVEHGGTADYEKDLSFFWAHFSAPDAELEKCRRRGSISRQECFAQYFTLLVDEQHVPDNRRTCDLLMEILLNETCRDQLPGDAGATVPELAAAAKRFINLKFAAGISSADVARELNCSRDYLGKVFRSAVGSTISQYINFMRCREAACLLRSGVMSVKEIAFFCGFNDLPHFRRQFFRRYSVTPGQYRRIHRVSSVNTMNT